MRRDPKPQWTSPAGHAFLPTSGSGATQAMEDAISLGQCLRAAGRHAVGEPTRVHAALRFERTSTLQRMGVANRQAMHRTGLAEALAEPASVDFKQGRWVWLREPEGYAAERFEDAAGHLRGEGGLASANLPPGYVYGGWSVEGELERERRVRRGGGRLGGLSGRRRRERALWIGGGWVARSADVWHGRLNR